MVVLARVTENVIEHVHRSICEGGKKGDSFAFETILVLICRFFISAFLKLLPFSKHFIQLDMCKINI